MVAAIGLGASLAPAAGAITKKRAVQVALKALKPARVQGRVVVFGLPRPLPRKTRVWEAAPKAAHGKPLAGKTWLFWADWFYDAQFEHPSMLLLVDDRTGRVVRRKGLAWYPLVNGKRPAFLGSLAAYHSARYHVYQGLPKGTKTAARHPIPAPLRPSAPPNLKNDCLLVIGDHEDPLFKGDFERVKSWAKNAGIQPNDVGTAEGLDLRIGVLSTITDPPCKDAMIVLIGHGWPENPINNPNTGKPVPTSSVPQVEVGHKHDAKGKKTDEYELVTGSDLARIISKYKQKVTFKIVVFACFSGRFAQWLGYPRVFPNVKIVATSSKATEFSYGHIDPNYNALPGAPSNSSFFNGVKNTTSNPTGAGEFTNGLFGGLDQVLNSPADLTLTGGDLAKMIARAFQLEGKGDFASQLRWTTPQVYVNPDAKVVPPPQPYTFSGATADGVKSSSAYGLNAKGIISGGALNPGGKQVVFKFKAPKPQKPKEVSLLGSPSGFPNGIGFAINTPGQVAGTAYTDDFSTFHPFVWTNGVFTDLGTLGGHSGFAFGINNSGQVVGTSDLPGGNNHPFLWSGGSLTDLGTLGGTRGTASDINDNGQVAGSSLTSGDTGYHAFRFTNGVKLDLGTPSGFSYSYGEAINGFGQVVGQANNGTGPSHAWLWNGGMTDLGVLPGDTSSSATSINDLNQIVGDSFNSSTQHPFLYSGGTMIDLNSLLPAGSGVNLIDAQGINLLGEIATTGIQDSVFRAFLLSPGPQAQLANVAAFTDRLNADRPAARRTGTGYFADRAIAFLDSGETAAACQALGQLFTDAEVERGRDYLTRPEADSIRAFADAVVESLGCT